MSLAQIFSMTKGNKLNEKISFTKTETQNNSTNQLKQGSCCSIVLLYLHERPVSTWLGVAGPDPEHSNAGGASGPDPGQLNTGYDVSGVSRKGGGYERGSPPLI